MPIPPQGSIPLANRSSRNLKKLSSLLAATRIGCVFVGSTARNVQRAREIDSRSCEAREFHPRVITRKQEADYSKAVFEKALAAKRAQLIAMLDSLQTESDKYLQREAELLAQDLHRLEGLDGQP